MEVAADGTRLARRALVRRFLIVASWMLVTACGSAPLDPTPTGAGPASRERPRFATQRGDAGAPEPDIDQIPWATGADVGYGVAAKDTQNPIGDAMFIAYGGYGASLTASEGWATALYRADLRARGVRYVWAVQSPADALYSQQEIGNSKIAAAIVALATDAPPPFVLVAGHSSGSFVAHELFEQLAGGFDPTGVTEGKVVYFALDGGGAFSTAAFDRMRSVYFVASHDGTTRSPNYGSMVSSAATWGQKGGFFDNDASGSGCDSGAEWCVHMTLVSTRPHDPAGTALSLDYTDFASRPVCTSFIDSLSW